MLSIEETELLHQAREGNPEARETLYNSYFSGNGAVRSLLAREVPQQEAHQGILQRVYLSVLQTERENRNSAKLQSDVYRLVQIALLEERRGNQTGGPDCLQPEELSGFRLGETKGERNEEIKNHLRTCAQCRDDIAFLARSQEPRENVAPLRKRVVLMGIAAAGLIASLIPWPWNKTKTSEKLDFTPSSEYRNLAHVPLHIDAVELLAESPAAHHPQLEQVLATYQRGDYKKTAEYAHIMTDVVDDPSAGYLQGIAEYRQGKLMDAYASMKVAERLSPSNSYRCWAMLQLALAAGDKATVLREARHVSGDARYRNQTAEILHQCCEK